MSFYIDMTFRAAIAVGGDDRRSFLQNLVTNDVEQAGPGRPVYACLLTPQGKFLHDFIIVDDAANGRFLLLCERERRADLIKRLTMYKLRSKVTLEDMGDKLHLFFIWGEGAKEGFADPRTEKLGRWLVSADGGLPLNATKASWTDYNRHRIMLGVPEGSLDMKPELATLLDHNIDALHGISWTKGCYTGQEVTARMNYRGLVRRKLYTVRAGAGDLPPPGTEVRLDSARVGELKSVEGDAGLALLKIEGDGILIANSVQIVIQNA